MKGQINIYTCPRGHDTVTIDRDHGVTPMMLTCRTAGCFDIATSHFYRIPSPPPAPAFEWYKPTAEEIARKPAADRGHYEMGGLAIRPIA